MIILWSVISFTFIIWKKGLYKVFFALYTLCESTTAAVWNIRCCRLQGLLRTLGNFVWHDVKIRSNSYVFMEKKNLEKTNQILVNVFNFRQCHNISGFAMNSWASTLIGYTLHVTSNHKFLTLVIFIDESDKYGYTLLPVVMIAYGSHYACWHLARPNLFV